MLENGRSFSLLPLHIDPTHVHVIHVKALLEVMARHKALDMHLATRELKGASYCTSLFAWNATKINNKKEK